MTIFFGNYLGYEEAHKSMVVVWSLIGCGLCNFPAWYYYLRVGKDILVGNTYLPIHIFTSNLCWVLKTTQ